MPNYAVVIGVQQYARAPSLVTPVADALRVAAWLLDPAGGNVPEANLLLLLKPVPPLAPSPPGVDLGRLSARGNLWPATHDRIRRAPVEVNARGAAGGERLYAYYAGHGMQVRIAFSNEDAIVPADYERNITNAVSVSSLLRYFQATRFPEQYFFFDCCRNVLPLGEEELDKVAPNQPALGQPVPDQFVVYGTRPGLEASDDRGMFTDVLLDGLAGKGKAKYWDGREYVVRFNRLFNYLVQRFEAMGPRAAVGAADGKLLLQAPRRGGEQTRDPALVTLPEARVPPVTLEVDLAPPEVLAAARASVQLLGAEGFKKELTAVSNTPVPFSNLSPRQYLLLLGVDPASRYEVAEGSGFVEVYEEPTPWPCRLKARAVAAPPPAPPGPVSSAPPFESAGPPPPPLTLTADDPMALLELLDTTGAVVSGPDGRPRAGTGGRLDCPGLGPGIYCARLTTPEGQVAQRALTLDPGQQLVLPLRAPGRKVSRPLERALELLRSRALGDAGPGLSSESREAAGEPAANRVEVLFAAELMPGSGDGARGAAVTVPALDREERVRAYLAGIQFRVWPLDGTPGSPEQPRPTGDPLLASFTAAAAPGAHWLWVRSAEGKAAAFPVVVLPDHTTQVVFYQAADGRIHVYQCLPGKRPDESPHRRLDVVQGLLERGQLAEARAALEPLTSAAGCPVAGCLAGLLLLREQAGGSLAPLGESLAQRYPGLPDGHVLCACSRELAGRADEARAGYRDALDRGLPLVAATLRSLEEGARRTGLEHPRLDLLRRVAGGLIPGLLWSAWPPPPEWAGLS